MGAAHARRSLTMTTALISGTAPRLPHLPRQSHGQPTVLDASRHPRVRTCTANGCVCAFLPWPLVSAHGQLWPIDSSSATPKQVWMNQDTQNTWATAPSLRTQILLIMTPQVTFTTIANRHRRRTSCLRLSQASARSSRHRTLRFPHELRSSSRATTTCALCLCSRADFRAGQIQSQRQSQKQSGGIAAAAANVGMTTTTMGDIKAVQ